VYRTKKNEGSKAAELIHGQPFIVEEMLGLQFEMSPTSFFQVSRPNTDF
jgi:tRNA/tmRNA/rRNA uracil-C5-methylase (TrmA/RlmC/RlmD family)